MGYSFTAMDSEKVNIITEGISDYNYIILIDQDKEGRKQYKFLINKLLVDLNDIKFVDGTNKENNHINFSIENLFSEEDKNNIGINNEEYSIEKAFYSLDLLVSIAYILQ